MKQKASAQAGWTRREPSIQRQAEGEKAEESSDPKPWVRTQAYRAFIRLRGSTFIVNGFPLR